MLQESQKTRWNGIIAVRSRDFRVSYRWSKITFQHGNRERFIHAFPRRGEREVIVNFSVTKQSLDRMVKENYLSRTQTASASRQQQIHTWLSFLSQWFEIVIFGIKEISSSCRDSYDFTSIQWNISRQLPSITGFHLRTFTLSTLQLLNYDFYIFKQSVIRKIVF